MSLKGVNFSKMDTEITIEYPVESTSTSGENQQPTWSLLKTCQAERRRRSGQEQNLNSQQAGRNPIDYLIRYDSLKPIDFKMRVYEGSPINAPETTYAYISDVQNYPREGYTFISVNRWDNG